MKKMHGISTKAFAALLAVTLLVGSAIGGTLAWLTADPVSVTNTFTIGNVEITLTETEMSEEGIKGFHVAPGNSYLKDPKVTVLKGSESCYVFVKVEDINVKSSGLEYKIDQNVWTPLDGEPDVYYQTVSSSEEDQKLYILTGNATYQNGVITVPETVTKLIDKPSLTFKAYAIQQDGFVNNPKGAWDVVSNPNNTK